MKYFLIGIDPDMRKSGFAVWSIQQKKFVLLSENTLAEIVKYLVSYRNVIKAVAIEASWKIDANWHESYQRKDGTIVKADTKALREAAKRVEINHYFGKQLCEIVIFCEIPLIEYVPVAGNKMDRNVFKDIYSIEQKLTQDMVDAGNTLIRAFFKNC